MPERKKVCQKDNYSLDTVYTFDFLGKFYLQGYKKNVNQIQYNIYYLPFRKNVKKIFLFKNLLKKLSKLRKPTTM